MDLAVEAAADGQRAVVRVPGELDLSTSPRLRDRLVDVISGGCRRLVLDLDGVTFLDSNGLSVLVGAHRRLSARNGSMQLVCTAEPVVRILHLTGLVRVFVLYGTAQEADAAYAEGGGPAG